MLTSARQVLDLSPDEAERHHPVRLRGVITYYFAISNTMIVQDSTAGILIDTSKSQGEFEPGKDVEVEGFSGRDEASNVVISSTLTPLGSGQMPEPQHVSHGDFSSRKYETQWVEVEGIVRSSMTENDGHLVLNINTSEGRVRAHVEQRNTPSAEISPFIDAKLRVSGVANLILDARGEAMRFELLVPSPAYLHVVEPVLDDPFSIPAQSVSSLSKMSPGAASHRLRLQGVLTQREPGELFLEDETGELQIKTA